MFFLSVFSMHFCIAPFREGRGRSVVLAKRG